MVQTNFKTANQLLREGKLDDAVAAYREAIALNPGFSYGHHNLGEALVKVGRIDEAIAAFRQAVAINPQASWSLYKLGVLLQGKGQFQEAVGYFRRAVEQKTDVPEFYLGLGAVLVKLGQWSEVDQCLDKVVNMLYANVGKFHGTSLQTEAYYYLGAAKSGQQQWSEAVEFYRRSWEMSPGGIDCCLGLAEALGKLEQWSEAVEFYRQAVVLSGESGEVLFGLGQALGQLGRWEEAVVEYGRSISLGFAEAEVRHHLGYALGQLGRWEEAVVEYRLVVEVSPKSAVVRHQLGYGLMQLGRWREAEVELRRSLELHPESTVVRQQLGDVLKELGKKDRVVELRHAKTFESTQFYSDFKPLIIFGNDDSIDLVSQKLFLLQRHIAETGLHILLVPNGKREALIDDNSRCNSLLVLANSAKYIADQKNNIPGGYWKTMRIDSESVLLSIFLEPGRFMARESFADILNQFQSLGPVNESKVHLPSMKLLIAELLEHQGDAYIESVERILEKAIDYVSNSVTMQRRSIGDLLNVLIFSPNSNALQIKLHSYLNNTVAELKATTDDSHNEILARRIDSCLYLAFELSGINSSEALVQIFNQAFEIMLFRKIPARMLSRGLRHSFSKAIELAEHLPMLIELAEITDTHDALGFLAIHQILQKSRSMNREPDFLKIWQLLKKIFQIPKQSMISLVRDLRRTVPCCFDTPEWLLAEIISAFKITEQRPPDRETCLARCLLLLYADCFDSKLLDWIATHYQQIGITNKDKDILLALAGYDTPLIAHINKELMKEGFKYKIINPSEYSTIADYMEANLTEWAKERQSYHPNNNIDNVPLISVVFTTFNPDMKLLRLSLESIIHQTYPALEIILIDDCSSDELSRMIQLLIDEIGQDSTHSIVYHRNNKNVGQYASRNIAIAMAKGEFIAIQDDDDISHPERLEYQLQPMLTDTRVMATHANHLRISENSRLMVDGDNIGDVLGDAPVSFIWRKQVFQEIGCFIPIKTRGDVEFRLRMRRHYSYEAIETISQPLVLMRGGMGTVSSYKEYYFRSALNAWRFMMAHIPIGTDGSHNALHWIPAVLK
ncbi:MAG: tetratricopeptide repeat protein [Okeania sp. SIO2C9]|uniref:tetratricopeptide repeat protein n=1 Tax=Okeania sp. SIO2C9 TaxID=2607791 RepID=UPI0013C006B3|nr:tetratricopeptide repeat protein [Okeania sp. SIO2C9]NEQ71642.1 tetratricopeptide repeat protein [Okeania sp. SIO2C9]